ncbi:MAG TPA: hypothetical protein VJL58_11485, partial [Pyrinomonadaceae bacterium]|nr:hypothetical protein [Pyrinomonadaceae bacterium]
LNFCLDDGEWLSAESDSDEPATAILASEAPTRVHSSQTPNDHPSPSESQNARSGGKLVFGIIAALLLAALGVGGYWLYAGRTSKQIDSIAVMPFVNASGNPEVEYLSDGMTEALMNSLNQVSGLGVKARSSVFRYKDKDLDVQTVGRELGVQVILNGRLVQRGDALTLFLELVDATTGNRIWGEQYERKQSDLVSLQSEIARDVSEKLRSKLSGDEAKKIAKKDTANPEANRLYMEGRFYWNKRRVGEMSKAIDFFQKAIDLDPNYAKAYAGLADAVAQPNDTVPYPERAERARAAAQKAISLDNELAEAHTALGIVLLHFDADFAGAERELATALKLDPKWIGAYQRLGQLYMFLGRHEESLAKAREGLEIEHFNIPLNSGYGESLTCARRYDDAITQLKKTVDLAPDHRNAHVLLAVVYGLKGMYPESVKHRIEALRLSGQNDEWAERIRVGFAKDGWPGVLRAELARFDKLGADPDRRPRFNKAAFLVALGENEAAFTELQISLESRELINLIHLKTDPRFDALRNDRRFPEMLRRIGFPD